jgi:hypothetical protein
MQYKRVRSAAPAGCVCAYVVHAPS